MDHVAKPGKTSAKKIKKKGEMTPFIPGVLLAAPRRKGFRALRAGE